MRILLATLILVSTTAFAGESTNSDWPQWLGPNRDGTTTDTNWNANWGDTPKIAWSKNIGIGFSSVSICDGKLYTMGDRRNAESTGYLETIQCLNADTGETIWEHSYPAKLVNTMHEGGASATPAVHDGRVYTVGKEGVVLCLDADSGKVIWETSLQQTLGFSLPMWGFCSSPLVKGDLVILQTGATIALNSKTGELVWKSAPHSAAYSSPSPLEVDGHPYLAIFNNDGLSILNEKTGEETGFAPWVSQSEGNSTTPLIIGDRVFVSEGYGSGCALYKVASDGSLALLYHNKEKGATLGNHFNNSVLVGKHLYGFDGMTPAPKRATLTCMELETGKVVWRQNGYGVGSLIAAGDRLIVLSDKGALTIVQATPDGHKTLSSTVQVIQGKCWTSPVLANGRLYCRGAKGDLVCIDLRESSTGG